MKFRTNYQLLGKRYAELLDIAKNALSVSLTINDITKNFELEITPEDIKRLEDIQFNVCQCASR